MTDSLLLLRNAEIFFLPVDYLCLYKGYMHESSSLIASWLHYKSGYFIHFTFSLFDQYLSLKASLIKHHVIFWFVCLKSFLSVWVPLCQEGPFLEVMSHMKGERASSSLKLLGSQEHGGGGSQESSILKFIFCQGCKQWRLSQSDELMSFCLVHYFCRYLTDKRYKI